MKEWGQKHFVYNLFIPFMVLAVGLFFPLTPLPAVPVEGNVSGEGSGGSKMAKAPADMISAAGDVTYSSLIMVPPGIHGMTPAISLNYPSSAGKFQC